MVFNKKFILVSSLVMKVIFGALLSACSVDLKSDANKDKYMVGERVERLTSLQMSMPGQNSRTFVFDEKVRKIHYFDIEKMSLVHSLKPKFPSESHFLLSHPEGHYLVDLTLKHMAIYKNDNTMVDQPVSFQGTPQSAAFDSINGYLVLYDDLSSVAILKLDTDGSVLSTWLGGPLLEEKKTISAGDIDRQKRLILSFSDQSIGIVDIEATLEQKKWVSKSFQTTLKNISWLAPLSGVDDTIMVYSENKVAIIDLAGQKILSETDADTDSWTLIKLSKQRDPHIVLRKTSSEKTLKILYSDSSKQMKGKTFYLESSNVLTSRLSLQDDSWAFVDTTLTHKYNLSNFIDEVKSARRYYKYRWSDHLAQYNRILPNETQISLLSDYIFAIFPSELGYAVRYSAAQDQEIASWGFNFPFLDGKK